MKTCGTCTLCCTVMPVHEIDKPANTRCAHQRDAPARTIGCAIYKDRPRSCKEWMCHWLASDWPDDMRPDRLGVVFDVMPDMIKVNGKEMVAMQAWVKEGLPDEIVVTQPVYAVVLAVLHAGDAILFRFHGGRAVVATMQDGKVAWGSGSEDKNYGGEPTDMRIARAMATMMRK